MAKRPSDSDSPYPLIRAIECKACGRCIDACPRDVLSLSDELNARGYHYAEYCGAGCTGCANCFYACPEPHAIEVRRPKRSRTSDD